MSVIIDAAQKLITIHTRNTTYQMAAGTHGQLLHVYYGKKCEGDLRYLLTYYDRGFSGNPYDADEDRTYSMDALPQEYPCFGTGDYRSPAFTVQNADKTYCADLRYESCEVIKGKYGLPGLPAVYVEDEEKAETLTVRLKDAVSGAAVTLYYGILEELDVITRAACISNEGTAPFALLKAASCALDFRNNGYDVLHFHGRHGMERILERSPVIHGNQVFGSRRGTSSHQQNPFIIMADRAATEETGECYGYSLLYSGNFKAELESDQYNQTRVLLGMSDELFSWELKPGEQFFTPEAAMSYSAEGLTALSGNFHRLIRRHICRGAYRDVPRPVLLNNWEATYFDFTGDKIVKIAEQAAELGVEMLVLDDGWFGKRDSDTSGLGDWFVNEEKLGGPLFDTAEKIRGLGMKFGLWIEPEMVSEDSELFREHPDWAFVIPGRKPVRARHQLVLDFSRKEVVDYIVTQICKVIDQTGVDYIKMDMNRHLTDIYSAGAANQNQGAILHRYVLGVYDFLERLCERYPKMLIEGCSGGGGRFDAGMLYYTPQIWCSDNTDAIERIQIQYGTSFGYPISAVGSHVSAVPNHQTGRTTEIKTRGVVAMAGSFGYELDLNLISEDEKQIVKQQIKDYKKYWPLTQDGNYFRLSNPAEQSEYAAWEFASGDKSEALLQVVTLNTQCNPAQEYVRLRGLDEKAFYRMEEVDACADAVSEMKKEDEKIYSGAALMYAGIPVPRLKNEYCAWQVHFTQVGDSFWRSSGQ